MVVVELQAAESGEANKAPRCDGRNIALGWAGLAAVQVAEGKWKEANSSVETGEWRRHFTDCTDLVVKNFVGINLISGTCTPTERICSKDLCDTIWVPLVLVQGPYKQLVHRTCSANIILVA